jgi:hypothetical protein
MAQATSSLPVPDRRMHQMSARATFSMSGTPASRSADHVGVGAAAGAQHLHLGLGAGGLPLAPG